MLEMHDCPECGKQTLTRYCSFACGMKAQRTEIEGGETR